ncbi:MAG: methionine--tRNA ligase [Candidatus Aenigmatarchaeota archaeon]
MFAKRVTVTSALPYINGIKHLGNIAGSMLPADVFHRFLDLFGVENIFICGTDDHGTACEIAAREENLSPEAYSNKYYKIQKEIYEKWCFDFTKFGRTHTDEHKELTQSFFRNLEKNGFIIAKNIILPYCKSCKKYLSDRFIVGTCPVCGKEAKGDQCESCGRLLEPTELINPGCVICGKSQIAFKKENHLFVDFAKLQPKLEAWLATKKGWPANTLAFAAGWFNEGLKPRDITRNLEWGISVPKQGFENLVFYVWFDAPIGYISITKSILDDWESWWKNKNERELQIYHFLGKDNIPFHTIFWPGQLIGDGRFALPHYVQGYEFLNWEGGKFSTSKHNGIFSDQALEFYPVDYWRYYLCRILPEGRDTSFEWSDFQEKINSELNDNYGNLFYRITSFIGKNFSGSVPAPKIIPEDEAIIKAVAETKNKVRVLVENVKLKEALSEVLALSDKLNEYFQANEPWALIKTDKERTATVLFVSANVLRSITVLLWPFIPQTAEKALLLLGTDDKKFETVDKNLIKVGAKVKSEILFSKITDDEIAKLKQNKKTLDIRIATVKKVEDHPNADKLYVMEVDLGTEKRQIVAGMKEFYEKHELEGKQIAVLTNLKPAKLRGAASKGMLLAADNGTLCVPLEKVKDGFVISQGSEKITYDDFKKHVLVVRNNRIILDGKELLLKTDKNVEDGMKVI